MGTVRIGKVLIMGGNKGRWQGTRDEMISLLARAKVEPYGYQGDGTDGEVRFRGIPIPGGRARVLLRGPGIPCGMRLEARNALGLRGDNDQHQRERVKAVQREIREKAKIKNALFGWRKGNS